MAGAGNKTDTLPTDRWAITTDNIELEEVVECH